MSRVANRIIDVPSGVTVSVAAGNVTVKGAKGSTAKGAAATQTSASASQVVSVKAGRTLVVPVKAPPGTKGGTPFAIVITPLAGSGPLYAARIETQGQGTVVSIVPAANAPSTISLPPVRDSYDAINP